jgi:hypothetical protein
MDHVVRIEVHVLERESGHFTDPVMALNDLGQSCSPKFPTWGRWSG